MTPLEQLAVLAAGLGSGVLISTVGFASLLSFPVLIALGVPPVVANASNTLGLTPAGLSGSFGFRSELREHPGLTVAVAVTSAVGAVAGAALLLAAPASSFEAVVPWLILATCLLVGVQPAVTAALRRRRERRTDPGDPGAVPTDTGRRTRLSPTTTGFATLTGVYGGYFGAGSGVMMVAVLGFGLDVDLRIVNALKTLSVLASNVVASVVFVALAPLDWQVVGLLAAGSVGGGYLGARVARHLPGRVLRTLIVVTGVVAAVLLLRAG
ncbi:sulfite exporter TauE/SafE family protein [Nocardioides alkalitolerans]|uniref:sulfite exporter TauE/SafE family protein n=1 Tax=Nocardioides alkalitolerans TaxID=281714 RepID=UPI0004267515|nr:sulfite exporter TauE/SafE family protein [Nocardioides alkalitolerans]